jgi:electron transfer flavoprotein beta subunit
MPRLLVLYKWTIDEKDIKIRPDLSLDTSRAAGKISDFDRNAIEEAARIVEQQGGSVEAISYGTAAVKKSLKDVLSRGVDKVHWIADGSADSVDASVIARVLAAAIRTLGAYDAILCGAGSSDLFNQQTGPRVAALLGLPCLSFVNRLAIDAGKLTGTRKLEDRTEVATVECPAVICLRSDTNKPRIPTLKQILGASKKENEEITLAALGLAGDDLLPKAVRRSAKGFVMARKNVIYKDGSAGDKVSRLVASLTGEGLL